MKCQHSSVHDITILQQHIWHHNQAYTGVPLATNKQIELRMVVIVVFNDKPLLAGVTYLNLRKEEFMKDKQLL